MFGFDVGVECGVAKVGFAAVAGKVAAVVIVACPTFAFILDDIF